MRAKEPVQLPIRPADTVDSGGAEKLADSGLTVISAAGDLILDVQDARTGESFAYRVESDRLRSSSPYFTSLLHPNKFGEGARLAAEQGSLRKSHGDIAHISSDELPHIGISDIGRTSQLATIKHVTADFLRALHDLDLATASPPIPNLANLAIVADRFDAVSSFSRYVRKRRYLQTIDARAKNKMGANLPEERVRQKLLIGVLLDHAPWVTLYSKCLIVNGSSRWKPDAPSDTELALWWDLPCGVEDELVYRREYVLETISSLQSHFLKLYTSGERQCKLGYDSSPQCDSFQLGEMIRFFSRSGTLRLRSAIYDLEVSQPYQGDIERLLDTFRQCPSYQIDRNHSHCGLRSKLIPLFDHIQNYLSLESGSLDVGICADCWQNHRLDYAWYEAKRPLVWTRSGLTTGKLQGVEQGSFCLARHLKVRDMFLAVDRDWTARDALSGAVLVHHKF